VGKDCIICGGATGSREHVFPAALGGRRVNKGIYCGIHNNGFSPLAAILSSQLIAVNALLGVRPDHSDEPRQLTAINPSDGQAYLLSALNVELASPRFVKDVTVDGVHQVAVQFSNESQIQQLLTEQHAAGFKVKIGRRQEGTGYFTEPFKVDLVLGGFEGLRAIGYIALTFLAHYFPQLARQAELKAFKDFVLAVSEHQPVWWYFSTLPVDIPKNFFRFGHRILIGLSAARQEAYARVLLFSTLNFTVNFGTMPIDADRTIIVDIDPQADHPPGDISEIHEERVLANVDRPNSPTSSLPEIIESGAGKERLDSLLRNISDWHMERIAEDLLAKINLIKAPAPHGHFEQVRRLVSGQGQCVLNLMRFVVVGLRSKFEADPAMALLGPVLGMLVAGDSSSATGIDQTTSCSLELATNALALQICLDHDAGILDVERLRLLMGGGPGAAIVGEAILGPFKMALGIARTKQ
jgi:hypothetical protein